MRSAKQSKQELEAVMHATPELLARAAAERWTVENVGKPWPEMSWAECKREHAYEGDDVYDGLITELQSWEREAARCVRIVVRKELPLTLASMELALYSSSKLPEVKRRGKARRP